MAKGKSSTFSWISVFTLFLLVWIPFQTFAANKNTQELVLLNWADYMDPELIQKFEKQFNAKVHTPFFDSDDHRTQLLVQSEGKNYDLLIMDTPSIETYREAGWLEQLDAQKIPNLKHVAQRWKSISGENLEYAIPLFWGTLGIAYRADLIPAAPKSWMDLFQPDSDISGKIAMYRNTIDIIGAAHKALGHPLNSTNPDELEQVKKLILGQVPHVRSYKYLNLDETSALVNGDVVISMFYNSDTLILQEVNENIQYIVPKEGAILWIDHLAVMKHSQNKDLALQFINFLNQPKHAAQLAEYVYTATTNEAAVAHLPEEFLQDTVIYPDQATLDKSEMNRPLPFKTVRQRNDIVTLLPAK